MKILITGGAGFIGSALIRKIIKHTDHSVINVDKLTYAGNLESLEAISSNDRYTFENLDICDEKGIEKIFFEYEPNLVMHLAAESHVDRSISGPSEFIKTNILGTYSLLQNSLKFYSSISNKTEEFFRFHHISTDEVYGDLGESGMMFTEKTAYDPSSPYSSSKASSDHLVRAWSRTYDLPTVITNCSNNYGPYHHPEKLIPKTIINALNGEHLLVYGDGSQIRDWLYVDDHADALLKVATDSKLGETYNIGGHNEKKNIEVILEICKLLEELAPEYKNGIEKYANLIKYVDDRPGHDIRYAIDASKINNDLGWSPQETFETGLRKTVEWYISNKNWWNNILLDKNI